jgi:pimeloyl-ACP methyl ester carboxylesterase
LIFIKGTRAARRHSDVMAEDVALRPVAAREIAVGRLALPGNLNVPQNAVALIVFAHGSGSSRLSPRNRAVARALNARGMATLLFDLLTRDEERDRANVFDIPLLAERLMEAVHWVDWQEKLADIPIGLFGASTGAAAALVAAARLGNRIGAVVSRGGRPDLAASALGSVAAPTLLIVGGLDNEVIALNEQAFAQLNCIKALEVVPGATHLFPEPGALQHVIALAGRWFADHLEPRGTEG